LKGTSEVTDTAGRSTAATLFMPIRRGGALWLRVLFWASRHASFITAPMRRLSSIHFLQWTVLRSVPEADGSWRRLPRPWLWFESNFDGNLPQYIDMFARALAWRMRAVWGMGEGYPGLFPTGPYQEWTDANAVVGLHYWCAYSEATTSVVGAALRVQGQYESFRAAVRAANADRFAAEYAQFLIAVQGDL
jgi:hypothetical protein